MESEHEKATDIHTSERLRATTARLVGIFRGHDRCSRLADALEGCGTWPAALRIGPDGCEAIYRNQCRERLCPVCATLKGARHRAALVRVVDERLTAKARFTLMSLTIPHKASDRLDHLIEVLFSALAKFRKTPFSKAMLRGWARGIEVTWSAKGGFHPHVHFIVEAGFINLDALHRTWATCVRKAGGGEVLRQGVDLKGLKDSKGLNEAIGYPFKVQGLATWPAEKIVELAQVVKGRRFYQACQKWSRRIKALEREAEFLAANESSSVMVPYREYLKAVQDRYPDACAIALSVLTMLRATSGLEEAASALEEALAASARRVLDPPGKS